MSSPLLQAVADCVKRGPKPKPWHTVPFDEHMRATFERESSTLSDFDQIQSRIHYNNAWNEGRIHPVVKQTVGGTVALFADRPEYVESVPWALWSRIFQLFQRPDGKPYTVYVCAHPALRTFPTRTGERIKPLHINGGYTYACDPTCVFIYRAEDATRVLLHELFHAACSDNPRMDLDHREAETEAWAELMWCGLMSLGDLKTLENLVAQQAQYIAAQNRRIVEGRHMERGPRGFPWRYTIGKEDVWRRWGIAAGSTVTGITNSLPKAGISHSLRLTIPPTPSMKQREGVPPSSTML